MKSRFVLSIGTILAIVVIVIIAMLMPIANADEIRITSIDDSYINKEVTVSGVVVSISYESGHKRILTIDDGSGTISVYADPRLFGDFYGSERITVKGIYVGGNMVYADLIYSSVERGYKDVTIAELKEFPEYYYGDSVRIKGKVDRIVLIPEKTELTIDDDTGEIRVVLSGVEMEDLKIGDEVIVEGKYYKSVISAFTIKVERPEQELNQTVPNQSVTPTPAPEEGTHPTTVPGQSPGPQTETPESTPAKPGILSSVLLKSIPFYLLLIVVSAAILGIFLRPTVEEWLMMRRYSK